MSCSCSGYLSHHDYRKQILLQSMTGKIINEASTDLKNSLRLELRFLREEYIELHNKLIELDNKILSLEVRINS